MLINTDKCGESEQLTERYILHILLKKFVQSFLLIFTFPENFFTIFLLTSVKNFSRFSPPVTSFSIVPKALYAKTVIKSWTNCPNHLVYGNVYSKSPEIRNGHSRKCRLWLTDFYLNFCRIVYRIVLYKEEIESAWSQKLSFLFAGTYCRPGACNETCNERTFLGIVPWSYLPERLIWDADGEINNRYFLSR